MSDDLVEVTMSACCQCGRVWHCKTFATEAPPLDSLRLSQCPMCRPPSGLLSGQATEEETDG